MIRLRDLLGEAEVKKDTPYVSGDTYINRKEAQYIYNNMGYNFDFEEFYKGMNVELEHQDVTDGSLTKTAMIAAAHLRENPKYYTLLLKYIERNMKEQMGGAPATPAPSAPQMSTGLNMPGGYIRGAPKPRDVKKVRKQLNKKKIKSEGFPMGIKLKDILFENVRNRVNLLKVHALLEKMLPELPKTEATKVSEMVTEICTLTDNLNMLPNTQFNLYEWQTLATALFFKVQTLKEEIVKLCGEKYDTRPFVKALDDIFEL